jgi:ArsR family transcriptional regulator
LEAHVNGVVWNRSLNLIVRRLKAMADPSRLAILHSLCEGEKNVTELVVDTGLSQANVSKHLSVLKAEGLVAARKETKNSFYRMTTDLPMEICNMICRSLESKASTEKKLMEHYWSGLHE